MHLTLIQFFWNAGSRMKSTSLMLLITKKSLLITLSGGIRVLWLQHTFSVFFFMFMLLLDPVLGGFTQQHRIPLSLMGINELWKLFFQMSKCKWCCKIQRFLAYASVTISQAHVGACKWILFQVKACYQPKKLQAP